MNGTEILLTIKLKETLFADPKRIRLLQEIEKCGSINQAAKNANVSYKSAWDHLEAMNKISPKPLLERNIGGKNGGGTSLTTYAERLLQLYDLLEQTQEHAFHILQDETIPLNSLLSATAKFSLQSSARNQFFGKVLSQHIVDSRCIVAVNIQDLAHPLHVSITLRSAERLKLITEKEVMVMFKAPWVKVSATPLEEKNNLFQATILSMQNEEAILQIKDSSIEFCASIHSKDGWKVGQEVWLHVEPEQIILATLK